MTKMATKPKVRMNKEFARLIAKSVSIDFSENIIAAAKASKKKAARVIYENLLGEVLIGDLKKLPDEYSTTQGVMNIGIVKADVQPEHLRTNSYNGLKYNYVFKVEFDEYLPLLNDRCTHRINWVMSESDELFVAYKEAHIRLQNIKNQVEENISGLERSLLQFKTLESAMETCPDISSHIEKFYPKTKAKTSLVEMKSGVDDVIQAMKKVIEV